jgi:putative PIN family toxin of toxin-antitoxin system
MKIHKRLKFVLDTNVILVALPRKSQYHWIIQKIVDDEIDIAITNEILLEYVEVIHKKVNRLTAEYVAEIFTIPDNIQHQIVYFHWNLIEVDPDDNKFIDCAVASNADYLVTNDNHFNIIKKIDFPLISIINVDEFMQLFKK